jgi:hypothetical protein
MRRRNQQYDWLESLTGERVGDYVLDRYIGCGKVGYVYEAHLDYIPENQVAVKLIPQIRPGWDVEIRKVARLSRIPTVVHFHHIGTHQITRGNNAALVQYTVWDYVPPGLNLREYLESSGPVPASFIFTIVDTILRVLHACAKLGIPRHGDLHAGNILLGEQDETQLDSHLMPIQQVYVSDFGYGATGAGPSPKDDYGGLLDIVNALAVKFDWFGSNSADRQLVRGIQGAIPKLLRERSESERASPFGILSVLSEVRTLAGRSPVGGTPETQLRTPANRPRNISVGQYQISEMLGDDWDLWRKLFVPAVPARSRILERDLTAVITGPRGCGKTMLFRRLSERVSMECGPIGNDADTTDFVAFYVNANDIADAFAFFPPEPSPDQTGRLNCFAHLSFLADVLAVEAVRVRQTQSKPSPELTLFLHQSFGDVGHETPVMAEEDRLERYRWVLEQIKRSFLRRSGVIPFPAYDQLAHHAWLKELIPSLRTVCGWLRGRVVLFLVDDYTTPRVSSSMQRVLNRIFFQRSSEFVFKIATEAATTFVAEDSSGKVLQDGDDYRLIDLGEESLFMSEEERQRFLDDVFHRRLESDGRVSQGLNTLPNLLGRLSMSKTSFARLLRSEGRQPDSIQSASSARGAARRRAFYFGHDVFSALWSGDTRIMIQLAQELVDAAQDGEGRVTKTVPADVQDRVFRNRGGSWLELQTRNQPTDLQRMERCMKDYVSIDSKFSFSGGTFGSHLKSIVEAFNAAARIELLGPVYTIRNGRTARHVPKMAFRIEVVDDFRLDGLAAELYRDLIRYGIFMRDARGKSVRGAMVPRLYLRRLLLPYCVLALSKRDSVSMTLDWFKRLLLYPEAFARDWETYRKVSPPGQMQMGFDDFDPEPTVDSAYDDTEAEDENGE